MNRTPLLNLAALIPTEDQDQPSKFLIVQNRNEEVFVPKDDNLQAWRREYIIPWGPLFDLFIVLLYIFFALTYQSSKIRFYLNTREIYDNFFFTDYDDYSAVIYLKEDLINAASAAADKFFDLTDVVPMQDQFTNGSFLFVEIQTFNDTCEFVVEQENVSIVNEKFTENANQIVFASLKMDYLITRYEDDVSYYINITYCILFEQVKKLGLIEMSSDFYGSNSVENGNIMTTDYLSVTVFPIALVVVDSFAIFLTLIRFMSHFKHAKEYAQKNYITLYRALLWKMDRFEIFNISFQTFTLISILLFIKYVNHDFGRRKVLLLLISFAGFIHCIGLFTHLRLKKETWFVARLVFKSIKRTLLFVFGFIPFYIAWTFLGLSLFGYFSELFDGFLRSLKILFSLMHTDVCMDTQDQLNEHAAAPSWLVVTYVVSWLFLTGGMVINILIAIVENTLEDLIKEG